MDIVEFDTTVVSKLVKVWPFPGLILFVTVLLTIQIQYKSKLKTAKQMCFAWDSNPGSRIVAAHGSTELCFSTRIVTQMIEAMAIFIAYVF